MFVWLVISLVLSFSAIGLALVSWRLRRHVEQTRLEILRKIQPVKDRHP